MPRDYPPGVIAVYDKPEFNDRYTVYFTKRIARASPGMHACLGMNAKPFHPQGIGQHGDGQLGRHNGRLIDFSELPPDCQKAVHQDLRPGG